MAAWGYGLLGPVEVRVDGRAVPLPGARQRLVLTMLLVDSNRMVPAGRLIDELWQAALPADPRGALRTQVSRLRRALGPAGGDLATLNARHGDTTVAFGHYERAIGEWQQAGAWTPLWVTIRTLVELLARAGAWHDAAALYGAVTAAGNGAPPFGADADRLRQAAALLRQHLTDTQFRVRVEKGEQMDGSQVIHFALEAIARAAANP